MKYVYLQQKAVAIRDTFKVVDEAQNLLYEARGKVFSLRSQRTLFVAGNTQPMYTIEQKIFAFVPTYFVYDHQHNQVAKMAQQLFKVFGTRFQLLIGAKRYQIEGDLFNYHYRVLDEAGVVVSISKKIISWGDAYQIAIQDDFSEPLAVAVVLMIDDFIDDRRKQASGAAIANHHLRGGKK